MKHKVIDELRDHLLIAKLSGIDALEWTEHAQVMTSSRDSGPLVQSEISGQTKRERLLALRDQVLPCRKCEELANSRSNVVFGSGNVETKLVFVGEAPGFYEDQKGLPFVGEAGQLLTKIIESIGLKREQVFICNVLKCRPPGNRNPLPDEVSNCKPYLMAQLEILAPKIICALGNFASQTLLQTNRPISSLRGMFHDFQGTKVMCTYHPAYLLRNPDDKRKVWEDMKLIRAELAQNE